MAEPQTDLYTPSTPLSSALNTNMQPSLPLSSMVKPFDIEKMSSKDVLKKEQEIMPLQRQADQNLDAVNAKVEQDVLTAKAESTSNYAKDINEKLEEKKKKEAEFPYPEFHPTQDNVKSLGELFSVMSVVGLMLGGSGKLSAMNALGSMSGMMKGWQEGRADLFKREKETFDKEFAKVKQFHSDLQQAFDEYMKLAPVNREAAMYAREQFIRQAGSSSILAAKMDKGELDGVAKFLASAKATIQHGEDKLQDAKETAERLSLERQRIKLEEARFGKIPAEVRNEVNDHYPHLNPESLANLGPDGAKRVIGGLNTIAQIEKVADFVKQNPNAVGGMAKLKNVIQLDAIKSITGDDPASAEAKSAVIDRQIDDAIKQNKITPDEARSAKVLNKMLFAVAISDVQSSGQRGSIYLDKQYQNLYDQASRLPTLMDILHARIEESNRNLTRVHMGIADRDDAQNYPLTLNGSEKWVNQNFPTYSTQQIDSAVQSGKLKNNSYFTTTDGKIHRIEIQGKNYYVR